MFQNNTTVTSTLKATCFVSLQGIKSFRRKQKNVSIRPLWFNTRCSRKIKEVETISGQEIYRQMNMNTLKEHPLVGTEHLVSHSNSQITFASATRLITYNESLWTGQRKYWTFWWWEFRSDSHLCWWGNNATNNTAIRLYYPFSSVGLNAGILIGL